VTDVKDVGEGDELVLREKKTKKSGRGNFYTGNIIQCPVNNQIIFTGTNSNIFDFVISICNKLINWAIFEN